jgi:hypothetical protein
LIEGGESAAAARRELQTLRAVVERRAKGPRAQLLQAALIDDKDKIRQIAEDLQSPRCRAEASEPESARRKRPPSPVTTHQTLR